MSADSSAGRGFDKMNEIVSFSGTESIQPVVSDPETNRLLRFEPESVGREFAAPLPFVDTRRQAATGRSRAAERTWSRTPTIRSQASIKVRSDLASVKKFDTQSVIEKERMFRLVFCLVLAIIAVIASYFVVSFH